MPGDVVNHALHRTGNGKRYAAGQCIAGIGREVSHLARRHMQTRRTRLKRAKHDAVARQDDAA